MLALSGCASHKADEYLPVNYKDLYLYPEKFDNQKVEIEGDANYLYGDHVFLGNRTLDDCKKSRICLDMGGWPSPIELLFREGRPECHRIRGIFNWYPPTAMVVGSSYSSIGVIMISDYLPCT